MRIFGARAGAQACGAWRGIGAAILSWMLACSAATGQTEDLVIDSFRYPTPDAAQAEWEPFSSVVGSEAAQPVLPATIEGVDCLSMPCVVTTTTVRGAWDKAVNLDLSAHRYLKFSINGSESNHAIRMVTVHLKTADGGWWYYEIRLSNQWKTFVLPLADFKAEGKCTGWGDIRRIRISAWQQDSESGNFALSDMRVSATGN